MNVCPSLITSAYSIAYSSRASSSASLPGPSLRSRSSASAGRGRRGVKQPLPSSPDSSPSPERPRPAGRKRKCVTKDGGPQQKKSCTTGGRKGKGKATERANKLWTTDNPATAYPHFSHEFEFGPTVSLPYDAAPTDFFAQVYPPQLIDLIVEQTNLYAEQRGVAGWVDTTAGEMEAFLGFVMATSVHRVPRLNNIWSSDWILGVPALARIFPRSCFWQLWANLHLADNTQAPDHTEPSFDRLYKLRPMLNILRDAFETAHEPSQHEAMVRFKGRLSPLHSPWTSPSVDCRKAQKAPRNFFCVFCLSCSSL